MKINYLPIGSVVELNESENLFMIVGLAVQNENDERRDYLAVKYPMGVLNTESYYFFNHTSVRNIVHKGFESIEHESYKDLLNAILSK